MTKCVKTNSERSLQTGESVPAPQCLERGKRLNLRLVRNVRQDRVRRSRIRIERQGQLLRCGFTEVDCSIAIDDLVGCRGIDVVALFLPRDAAHGEALLDRGGEVLQ